MPPKKKTDIKKEKAKASKDDSPQPKSKGKGKKAKSPPKKDPSPEPPARRGKKSAPKDDPQDAKDDKKLVKAKSEQKIIKIVTKGNAAVDLQVPSKDQYRVFQDGNKTYSAILNQANMDNNNNKFYIVQILMNEKTNQLTLWNRWGRVGSPGQNCMKGPFPKDTAIREYSSKVRDKTVKGDYRQLEIKYEDDAKEEPKKQEKKEAKNKKKVDSKMDDGLQRLINLIFDVNIMNNTMKQIGYDAKKMPLGKLGENTIKQAYQILNKLTKAIKKNQTEQYSSLSGDFFSLIPHDFGYQKMKNFILDNDQKVKTKLKMLQAISDMKITTKLLSEDGDEDTAVLDQNYKKLGCNIKTVQQNSAQYKLMNEYFDNTKGVFSKVKVGNIYEVERPPEHKSFNSKVGNNMLLWHGSRISNFVGILSQGLRIAPPEAPVSGYLFGKGIYLADMAQKSIHYCRSHGSDTALILLIEGAIGNPNVLLNSSYQAKELMQQNKKNSTKCHGSKAPPQSCYVNHKKMIIPNGQAVPTGSGSYMGHNEFIIYNINQARIRYIIEMDMKGS